MIISINLPDNLIQLLDTLSSGNRSYFIRTILQSYQNNQLQSPDIKQLIRQEFSKLLQDQNILYSPNQSITQTPEITTALYDLASQMMEIL